MSAVYAYATGDLLAQPNTYFYSAFGGEAMLDAWEASRGEMLRWCAIAPTAREVGAEPAEEPVARQFAAIARGVAAGDACASASFARLVQRFEVTKRVYGAYDARWRAVDATDYRRLARYVAFGELLTAVHAATARLDALNALLKLNDIVCAHREDLAPADRARVAGLLRAERDAVCALATSVGAWR